MRQTWKQMNNTGKGVFIFGSIMIIGGGLGLMFANGTLFRQAIAAFVLGWYYLTWSTTDTRLNISHISTKSTKAAT